MPALLDSQKSSEIAYLGPEGSFAHMVAKQRYPKNPLVPLRSVTEVFDFLQTHEQGKGVVPIENSSGGLIVPTVDGIIDNALSVIIEEELSVDVRLALLGRKGEAIRTVFSHFAPLHHCESFLKANYPAAKTVACASTSCAAEEASKDKNAAAIGPIVNAELYDLEVIEYPILKDVPNVTQFYVVGHTRQDAASAAKTALVVGLPNQPGSLCKFLEPFAQNLVNLTRIQSRPIIGEPNTYRFLIEIRGNTGESSVKQAIQSAGAVATHVYDVGSFPVRDRYQS
jgi:prephenate dehydratase